jgi:hypothetical protein
LNRVAALIAILLLGGCGSKSPEDVAAEHCSGLSGDWQFICVQTKLAELKRAESGQ